MSDFTELKVSAGVGAYHFNRFRVAFHRPAGISAADLAMDFVNNFPLYFSSPYAIVKFHWDRTFDAKPTLRFHGYMKVLGVDLARPHTDWVVRHWFDNRVGFTAQTLKREFIDAAEDVAAGAGAYLGAGLALPPALSSISQLPAAAAAIHYNRMHFLAGRRSWRIDEGKAFGLPANRDLIVLETIAVERFSGVAFMVGDAVAGLESKIPDIWISNLNNFVNKRGLTRANTLDYPQQWTTPHGQRKDGVDFTRMNFPNVDSLKANEEFRDAYRLYPTILPD